MEAGSALSESRPARQAFLMDMAKMGFISPQQLLDLLQIGGIKKLQDLIRVDMRAAQIENLKMKKLEPQQIMLADFQHQMAQIPDANGNIDPNTINADTGFPMERMPLVPVNEWDNHAVHIEVHNRFRKGQEFQMLDDAVKQEFATHIRYHEVANMMNGGLGQGGTIQPGMPMEGGGQPQIPGMPGGQGMPPGGPGGDQQMPASLPQMMPPKGG